MRKRRNNILGKIIAIILVLIVGLGGVFFQKLGINPSSVQDFILNEAGLSSENTGVASSGKDKSYSTKYYDVKDLGEASFTEEELRGGEDFLDFTPLDNLNRVGVANALIGPDLMARGNKERGDISKVYPTGWKQKKYDFVESGYLYNRSHLIGHQLCGEDDNWLNLITGTRAFNVAGMLPYENLVASYVKTTGNQVRYRIIPEFDGDNLLADGIIMEGYSLQDKGKGVNFRVFVPNIQPGVEINYSDGSNVKAKTE